MLPSAPPSLPGVTHTDVQVGRARWHVALAGEDGAPTVVLLHGWPQHWWTWRHQIAELARTHRVVCPDLRGMGWSDAPPGTYGKVAWASDVLDLLDKLEVGEFDLAGHDWGGFVAFLVALKAPERVKHLCALSIVHPWIASPGGLRTSLATAAYQLPLSTPGLGPWLLRRTSFVERILRRASPALRWEPQDVALYVDALRRPEHAQASSAVYRTFVLRELQPLLRGRYRNRTLPMPVLLATGSDEAIVTPERVRGLERHAPRSRTVIVDGAGHFLPEERPEETLALLREGFGLTTM